MRPIIAVFASLYLLLGGDFPGALAPIASPAYADSIARVEATHSTARLISEGSSLEAGRINWVALEIDPRKGWHTYWTNPGDSGQASIFAWDLPKGVTAGEALYGTPSRLPYDPLVNYGYKGKTAHLVPVSVPADASGMLTLKADIEWLVCEQECIPQNGVFELELPVGDGSADKAVADVFERARANLPQADLWAARLDIDADKSLLTVFMDASEIEAIGNAYYFPLLEGVTVYAEPQVVQISDEGLTVRMTRYADDPVPAHGNGLLKIFGTDGAVLSATLLEAEVKAASLAPGAIAPSASSATSQVDSWWLAAIYAFVGGLILNLMPCVFPVLSLKAFAFMKASDHSQRERIMEGWSYTAGIVASFAVIVTVLMVLRAGGEAVGWAFQLQNPVVLATMVIIMVLLGLSMSGMFEISTGFEGAGQGLASQGGNRGAFFTGVLATLVATPCTAPFMGAALGFAFTQPIYVAALVFLMLALGLAFPFLLLSYSPKLASMLPRPGAWMDTLKQFFAFPLYLTAAWLLWTFTAVAGEDGMFQLTAMVVLLVMAIWMWQQGAARKLVRGAALLLAGLSLYYSFDAAQSQPAPAAGTASELAFSRATLQKAVGGDQPVFAYFTAKWCITCKVNERTVLFRDETKALFADNNVKLIKGDWTNKNAEIANLLAEYQRVGVPLYLYFPAGQTEPVILPEVLTIGLVKDAIEGV